MLEIVFCRKYEKIFNINLCIQYSIAYQDFK